MPSCFFNKRPKTQSGDTQTKLLFYRSLSEEALEALDNNYQALLDIQGRNFSVTYLPLGRAVETHAKTAVDFWASVVTAIDEIKVIGATDQFKP